LPNHALMTGAYDFSNKCTKHEIKANPESDYSRNLFKHCHQEQ
jgi:hypothetical protein